MKTWRQFPSSGQSREWWRETDMLFVGYPSDSENIEATSFRLRTELARFFPALPDGLVGERDASVRAEGPTRYSQLIVVGHSQGGVVVRRALCEAAHCLVNDPEGVGQNDLTVLLDAKVRLFSPASGGFRPSGKLGQLKATPLWPIVRMKMCASSAFNDLQEGSQILRETRERTEAFVDSRPDDMNALKASILWANPENIVITSRYRTDHPAMSADKTNHASVCKPQPGYDAPWRFVETGSIQ